MKIRKAAIKDWPAIKKLLCEFPDKLMQKHLPKPSAFFVAIVDGKIVGCCALDVYSKRLAELRSLAVTKKSQGQGIASKLVAVCVAAARKKKIYEVLAISGSEKFFAKHSFHTFHQEKYALLNILG
ncbi:MAG: N-acetyltransferase GCN5 [Parcubacteria group bacterium GW2011_GWA2_51_10]|nr:MAG: N-acetyltransferase GCN5 [Parcubacteria group bacterium GW2011_GWA2_51_10]